MSAEFSRFRACVSFFLREGLSSPLFCFVCAVSEISAAFVFFVSGRFFAGAPADFSRLFSAVPYICVIAVPALCYRKPPSGYDAFIPAGTAMLCAARFMAGLIQFSLMLLCMSAVPLAACALVPSDPGCIAVSAVCLLFYGAAAVSLCVFAEAAAGPGIPSFALSSVVLAAASSAHLAVPYTGLNSPLSAFLRAVSFVWHFNAAERGIADTRDLSWYAGTAFIFVFLAYAVLELRRGRRFGRKGLVRLAGILAAAVLSVMNCSRWHLSRDFSGSKTFSVSGYSSGLLGSAGSELKLTYYRSRRLESFYPQVRGVYDFLVMYASSAGNVSLTVRNSDGDPGAAAVLSSAGIRPQRLRAVSGNSTEYVDVYSAVVAEYGGKSAYIPFVMSSATLEYDLDVRISSLLSGKRRTVNILCGNSLSPEEDYGYIAPWLESQGFGCNVVSAVPEDSAAGLFSTSGPLVVLGDSSLTAEQTAAVELYLADGRGDLFAFVSPVDVAVDSDWSVSASAGPLCAELERWGCAFGAAVVCDTSCADISMYGGDGATDTFGYPMWVRAYGVSADSAAGNPVLFWPAPLELSGSAMPLLFSGGSSWLEPFRFDGDTSLVDTNPFSVAEHQGGGQRFVIGAEISGTLTGLLTGAEISGRKVYVIPDQFFLSSLMNGYIGGYGNFDFLAGMILESGGEEGLSAVRNKSLSASAAPVYSGGASSRNRCYVFLFAAVPAAMAVCHAAVSVTRRKVSEKWIEK